MRGVSWNDALIELLERNEKRGEGPTTFRGLARRMAVVASGDDDHQPAHREIEQYRRALRRYSKGEREPTAETRILIATAALVPESDLPEPRSRDSLRRQYAEALQELEALRVEVADLRRRRRGKP